MLSDIEIAESCKMKDIREIAEKLGLDENNLELYGKYKAKISLDKVDPKSKLILVTAINPTAGSTLFPYTTLFRSDRTCGRYGAAGEKGLPCVERAIARTRVRH